MPALQINRNGCPVIAVNAFCAPVESVSQSLQMDRPIDRSRFSWAVKLSGFMRQGQ